MKKNWEKKLLTYTLSLAIMIQPFTTPLSAIAKDITKAPSPLVVSEILPDTENVGGADAYEFIEIYNTSNKDQTFQNYKLIYTYPNPSSNVEWQPLSKEIIIPAKSTIVLWIKNGKNDALTTSDFNAKFGTSLQDGVDLFLLQNDGMANGSHRGLSLQTQNGEVLTSIEYNEVSGVKDVVADRSITYSYRDHIVNKESNQTPTPGTVPNGSVDEYPIEDSTLSLRDTTSQDTIPSASNVTFSLQAESNQLISNASLFIKINEETAFTRYALEKQADGNYHYDLSGSLLEGKTSLDYYFEVTDLSIRKKTNEKTLQIQNGEIDTSGGSARFLLTELLPDSANITGTSTDAFEFIELYNNSDIDLNLKDYKLYYTYPDKGDSGDVMWASIPDDITIPSGGTLVFWIKNGANDDLTIDDFNAQFSTALVENKDLVIIASGGMANSGPRGVKISSNTGKTLNQILYNMDGKKDTSANGAITYGYDIDTNTSSILDTKQVPSPGSVRKDQVPASKHHIDPPTTEIQLRDNTPATFQSDKDLSFSLATTSPSMIYSTSLFLKGNQEQEYTKYNLLGESDFAKTIRSVDLIGKKSYSYYFVVSDGFNEVSTPTKTIYAQNLTNDTLRLNVKNGDIVSKQTSLRVSSDANSSQSEILINDVVQTPLTSSLETSATIAIDVTQTDIFFKNAISMKEDGELLGTFDDGTYSEWETIAYDIPLSYTKQGEEVSVYIHAGTKASEFLHFNEENNDDFILNNVRLILADGRQIRGTAVGTLFDKSTKDVDISSNPQTNINMGDSAGKYEILKCSFTIPEDAFIAKEYLWDTTTSKDGSYVIQGNNGTESISSNVIVDNTAPLITTNMEEKQYKGTFTMEASAQDEIAGVEAFSATLDDLEITLPYETSSALLLPGTHRLCLVAIDKQGNTVQKEVNFTTPLEAPGIIGMGQLDGTDTAWPLLSLQVKDSTNDLLSVTFKQGQSFTPEDDAITSYAGVTSETGLVENHELTKLSPDEIKQISSNDNTSLSTSSTTAFPYQMFEIKTNDAMWKDGTVKFTWEGTANENARISVYAYHPIRKQWNLMNTALATKEPMSLLASMDSNTYVQDNIVKVLVQNGSGYAGQDQSVKGVTTQGNVNDTPRDQYDFTLAWESDTQYYNANDAFYPHQANIHDWVLENKERMNIQYMFHTGDIVDNSAESHQWEKADPQYKKFDDANFPYGVLAGNHDIGHKDENYDAYSQYFGESRYLDNPWYGGSYKDNRGHYDLLSIEGVDFIMLYMGWGIGDEEIAWMNDVLAQYPERVAILNFHEYLLQTKGLGEIPQRIYDDVVTPNANVKMVLSGHYHQTTTRIDAFDDDGDGLSDRKVWQILFDYQGLSEGGLGYIRLMHFNLADGTLQMRTYSPSLDVYNSGQFPSIDDEEYSIPLSDLGIQSTTKTLSTNVVKADIYSNQVIGSVDQVASGSTVKMPWVNAPVGKQGWYGELKDAFGGSFMTPVSYVNAQSVNIPLPEDPDIQPSIPKPIPPIFTIPPVHTLPNQVVHNNAIVETGSTNNMNAFAFALIMLSQFCVVGSMIYYTKKRRNKI